jgi:hypothetical protein
MSVQGSAPLPFRPFPGTPASRPPARPASAPPSAAPVAPAAPAAAKSSATASASAAPPANADSSLWGLLSDEERDFFSQQASLGALTYGRAGGVATAATRTAAAPLGQRLDVRG